MSPTFTLYRDPEHLTIWSVQSGYALESLVKGEPGVIIGRDDAYEESVTDAWLITTDPLGPDARPLEDPGMGPAFRLAHDYDDVTERPVEVIQEWAADLIYQAAGRQVVAWRPVGGGRTQAYEAELGD